jgi:3-hydroxyacyl-CoA dehydrogenase / enoyl-CoA hydratase / 3-hydroxybutyryl-CoA epimerase
MPGFNFRIDPDGVAIVTMDMPDQSVNTMNAAYGSYMSATIERIRSGIASPADGNAIKGAIFTSAKKTFFAGGDIATILRYQKEKAWNECFDTLMKVKLQLMELESLRIPIAAAINGAALGGGFEICLACHYRVALDTPAVQIGFPEVSLGLLPAAGGIVRSVRLLGLKKAVPLLMEGTRLSATKAKEAGLIDATATNAEEMISKAKAWVLANPEFQQPWLRKGTQIPGGNAFTPANAALLAMAPAVLRKKSRGLLPAPEAILAVAAESTMTGYQAAMVIESRYFEGLLRGPESAALIGTMYKQLNEIGAKASRPKDVAPATFKKLGILGAGMMGRGIAYVAAAAGLQVVLKDVSLDNATAGKSYSTKLLDKQIERGRATPEKRDAMLALIQPSVDNAHLADCDIVIEAVFEDIELKHSLTREILPFLRPDCLFASNTSTLPISLLADAHPHPERFIGLHFFSPVDKMNLVEIIKGKYTDEQTLARAYDFVQQICKTPIIVGDGRGFYTSRVFGVFCDEGIRMLEEGVDPLLIENVAKQCGMPVGPLAVMDEVEITLMAKVAATNKRLDEMLRDDFSSVHERMNARSTQMVAEGRTGRAAGKGFYDYAPDGSKTMPLLWKQTFGENSVVGATDIKDRLLFRQSIETLRCLERGVLQSARDANIGAIFGWGFPAHTGGTLQLIEGYGRQAFKARAEQLALAYGERFRVPTNFDDLMSKVA